MDIEHYFQLVPFEIKVQVFNLLNFTELYAFLSAFETEKTIVEENTLKFLELRENVVQSDCWMVRNMMKQLSVSFSFLEVSMHQIVTTQGSNRRYLNDILSFLRKSSRILRLFASLGMNFFFVIFLFFNLIFILDTELLLDVLNDMRSLTKLEIIACGDVDLNEVFSKMRPANIVVIVIYHVVLERGTMPVMKIKLPRLRQLTIGVDSCVEELEKWKEDLNYFFPFGMIDLE